MRETIALTKFQTSINMCVLVSVCWDELIVGQQLKNWKIRDLKNQNCMTVSSDFSIDQVSIMLFKHSQKNYTIFTKMCI